MLKFLKFLAPVLVAVFTTGCASILLPKKQKVAFTTNHSENEIYLDNESIGKGKNFISKIDKKTTIGQIVVTRNGYKNAYDVILKNRRQAAFWPLQIPNIFFGYYGFAFDFWSNKCKAYDKVVNLSCPEEFLLPLRTENDKFINVSNISLDIKDKNKDLIELSIYSYNNQDLLTDISACEKSYYDNLKKKQIKEEKKKKKNGDVKKLVSENDKNEIKSDDTEYSTELFKTLKSTKFIDTVNKIFNDQNNTIVLEGAIKKITAFTVNTRLDVFFKAKIDITWYLLNTYDEILDSIVTSEFSGNFSTIYDYNNTKNRYLGFAKMVGDAVSNSYIKLHKNKNFLTILKLNKDFKINDPSLSLLSIPKSERVNSKIDGFKASVIVKTKENNIDAGHGSGFAITKDGYILTNYHVIAGKFSSKQKDIIVVTSTGAELPAKIVRFNKFRDVALLKVNYNFEKVFYLSRDNKAEVMLDVYTIGAPKSIELGQSVSVGIISSIRDVNENKYLQLGMPINGGNSGGSIFDQQGNLHGIVVSKLVGFSTEGVGFAIPSHLVSEYLNLRYN